ncbi:MAG TPA: DUF4197 domain-containing protein [Chitinophagaceae bacterium]
MKRFFFIIISFVIFSACDVANQVINESGGSGNLTTQEIVSGLKQALTIGAQNSSDKLSAVDGFFANAAIKILMPPEAKNVESTLRNAGFGSVVDKAILSMNRAAEDAAKSAAPIFIDAITKMTITDAIDILKGNDYAATNYFKQKTTGALTNSFRPVINNALSKVDATKYWSDVFSVYNKFTAKPVNTDLGAFVTSKAIDGIFYQVGLEEQKIRKDPAARVTDLLKKVFGSPQAQKR